MSNCINHDYPRDILIFWFGRHDIKHFVLKQEESFDSATYCGEGWSITIHNDNSTDDSRYDRYMMKMYRISDDRTVYNVVLNQKPSHEPEKMKAFMNHVTDKISDILYS